MVDSMDSDLVIDSLHTASWLLGCLAAGTAPAVAKAHLKRRDQRRQRARESLQRKGFLEKPEGWELEIGPWLYVHGEIRNWAVLLTGPPCAGAVPHVGAAADDDEGATYDPTGPLRVPSGDQAFDEIVYVASRDADQALCWLTAPRRHTAMRAVTLGARVAGGRWRMPIRVGELDRMEEAMDRFVEVCQSWNSAPDRQPRIGLHPLTHDPHPRVRVRAVERLIARGELPASVARRLERDRHEGVRLALIDAGGERAVRLAARIMLCGRKPIVAALKLARLLKIDPYAAEAIDTVVEELLVQRLIEALPDWERGPDAARALNTLYLPHLPRLLHERFGPEAPPWIEALRWRSVVRYQRAWGDSWPEEAAHPPLETLPPEPTVGAER